MKNIEDIANAFNAPERPFKRRLRRLGEVDLKGLGWVHPTNTEYELVSGQELAGRLRWERGWGARVLAEAADGKWFFRLKGILRPQITITRFGSYSPISSLKMNVGGEGVLDMPDGRRFYWIQVNWWNSEWAFTDFNGIKVVILRSNFGRQTRTEPAVVIDKTCTSLPHLSLLILLGWYLMLLKGATIAPPHLLV